MTATFAELGIDPSVCHALADRGITEAFAIQEMTIPDILAGRDVCGKAKTGSGKTLAFGLPIVQVLERAAPGRPTAIAMVPTRELAVQVRDELLPAAHALRAIDLIERGDLTVADVQHVVIDEADRMADMGFLPQVEWILRNVEAKHQTLLFSATLDGVVDGLIRRYQHEPTKHEVASRGATVEQMTHLFLQVHEMDKVKVCAAIIRGAGRTMVFSATKHGADRLAGRLEDEGVRARAIHGDLRQNIRERALADFSAGKVSALVATDVAARGIHVDDVDVVVHYDPPNEHKSYLHRSGRTARAGESGVVVSLVLWNQELEIRRMQKRLGLDLPVVEVFSNDPRLGDLAHWED
jgi:superfamily II DNA/RNA helicase